MLVQAKFIHKMPSGELWQCLVRRWKELQPSGIPENSISSDEADPL